MASMIPPVKGAAFAFDIALVSQASPNIFQTSATISAGDVLVSKDGGAFANITTLPTEIGTSGVLPVALSATEMNADRVTVRFHDAAGDEWQDALVTIYTAAQTLDTTDGVVDSRASQTSVDDVPTVSEFEARTLPSASYFDPAADTVKLDATQGAVTFGQVKIVANVAGQGALDVLNQHANGIGTHNVAGLVGQRNVGGSGIGLENASSGGVGQRNAGPLGGQSNVGSSSGPGQYNEGSIGQYNNGTATVGQRNEGAETGQYNYGATAYGVQTAGDTADYDPALGGASLDAQDVADALKLAPTAGAAAAGSVYAELDAILADTDELQTDWTDGGRLDLLLDAAGGAADPLLNAVPGAYAAGTAGYVIGSLTSGVVLSIPSPVSGSTITATIAASLAATLTGLTISADWAKVYLTVKRHTSDTDAQSLLQVVVSNPAAALMDGTLYVNGAAASVAQRTQAAITVTQATGVIAIALDEALTGALREGFGLAYDLKELTTSGAANVLALGTWNWVYTPTWAVT